MEISLSSPFSLLIALPFCYAVTQLKIPIPNPFFNLPEILLALINGTEVGI